jgi:hypothetical protein
MSFTAHMHMRNLGFCMLFRQNAIQAAHLGRQHALSADLG